MKKIILIFLILILPLNVFANDLEINSKSAIVVNRNNNDIIFEKNINEKLPIASLTKIMTVLVTLENITSLDSTVTVMDNDIKNLNGYQIIGLTNGMEISYKDLLYSTIMYSASDSAMVLANNVFNDYDKFIIKMNELALNIGMKNTKFSNPVGFDNNNYSTSYDLYFLLDYALKNENFYNIFTTKSYKIDVLDKSISNNINNLIEQKGIENYNIKFTGYKGGYTNKSGLSLSALTKVDNNELIIIAIGANGSIDSHNNIIDSLNILKEIKRSYSNRVILENNKLIDNIIYKDGNKEMSYEIRASKKIEYYMDNTLNLNYLKVYYDGKTIVDNNIKNNEELGQIKIYYENKLLDSVSVNFNKKYIVKDKKNYKNLFIFIGICLLGLIVFKKKK